MGGAGFRRFGGTHGGIDGRRASLLRSAPCRVLDAWWPFWARGSYYGLVSGVRGAVPLSVLAGFGVVWLFGQNWCFGSCARVWYRCFGPFRASGTRYWGPAFSSPALMRQECRNAHWHRPGVYAGIGCVKPCRLTYFGARCALSAFRGLAFVPLPLQPTGLRRDVLVVIFTHLALRPQRSGDLGAPALGTDVCGLLNPGLQVSALRQSCSRLDLGVVVLRGCRSSVHSAGSGVMRGPRWLCLKTAR